MLQATKEQVHGTERKTWREIDEALRALAITRGALDAEEALLLCSAVRREIWRNLGRASLLEYLEEVLGYTPKSARERVRVAMALDDMPALRAALAGGELSYSAVRELTRVATASTESEWREAARGKNVRQLEELVAVHRPGDLPSDPPEPDLKPRVLRFEVSTATFARVRQVQQVLADEHGGQLDDEALLGAMCDAILNGSTEADEGRAKHQVLTIVCESCKQGWQQGGNLDVPINAIDVEMAECDAQRIGSDREPARATQDVTPKLRRHVHARDRKRCQVPGCRAARHVDVHHIVRRADGGGHGADNLIVLCAGHHRALHEGHLAITGRAPDIEVTWKTAIATPHVGHSQDRHGGAPTQPAPQPAISTPHVGHPSDPKPAEPSKYARVVMKTEATQALTQLGFKAATARRLVEDALDGAKDVTLDWLLREALRLSRAG